MRGKSAYSALANWLARQRPTMTGWASKTLPLQIAKVRRCHACLQQCEGSCGALGTLRCRCCWADGTRAVRRFTPHTAAPGGLAHMRLRTDLRIT